MTEGLERPELRNRHGGGGWLIIIFVSLPVLYVLSPPPVALLLGPDYLNHKWFTTLYFPLVYLSKEFEFVNSFYDWYARLLGL